MTQRSRPPGVRDRRRGGRLAIARQPVGRLDRGPRLLCPMISESGTTDVLLAGEGGQVLAGRVEQAEGGRLVIVLDGAGEPITGADWPLEYSAEDRVAQLAMLLAVPGLYAALATARNLGVIWGRLMTRARCLLGGIGEQVGDELVQDGRGQLAGSLSATAANVPLTDVSPAQTSQVRVRPEYGRKGPPGIAASPLPAMRAASPDKWDTRHRGSS